MSEPVETAGEMPATGAEGGSQGNEASKAANAVDAKALVAEMETLRRQHQELQGKYDNVLGESIERRKKLAAEKEAAQKVLEEQGQYKALADELKAAIAERDARLAEMESVKAKAEAFDRDVARRREALGEKLKAIPEADRNRIEAMPDVATQEWMADRLLSATTKSVEPAPPPKRGSSGAPPMTSDGRPNFVALQAAGGDAFVEAVKSHPTEWRDFLASHGAGAKRQTLVQRLRRS